MTAVIAHRGARSLAPENTLMAAEIGYDSGADLWETDVRLTRDRQLILFHDSTLDRCTDVQSKFSDRVSTRVIDFSLDEILMLDAGSYFVSTDAYGQIKNGSIPKKDVVKFKHQRIPTLEEGLSLVMRLDWAVNLELKSDPFNKNDHHLPDQTVSQIRRSGIAPDQVKISSFNHTWLNHIREVAPEFEIQALVGDDLNESLDFGDYTFDIYNVNADLVTENQIVTLKSLGKKVNVFTINDPESFNRFASLKVDGIFTDFPQRFSKIRRERPY